MIDKVIIGSASAAIGLISYFPYFRDIFLNKTKPHIFSWFVWGLISSIAFFAQISEGAGPGAWVVGAGALTCFLVSAIAFFKGDAQIAKSDWIPFLGAVTGLILWQLTSSPLLAVIFVTIADALAFIPSFKKAYNKPSEETLITWLVSCFKFILALFATESYSATTVLYPLSLIVSNGSFSIMLLARRKKLNKLLIVNK